MKSRAAPVPQPRPSEQACIHSPELLDANLVELMRAGDLRGLDGLFERHGPACLSAAVAAMKPPGDVESLVFEVFMAAWRHPPVANLPIRQFLVASTLQRASQAADLAGDKLP